MATSSLVSLISKKIIKPSIQTPLPLRSHKLSFLDQVFDMSIPFAFFYPKKGGDKSSDEPSHMSQLLESSLSKALSYYYPYAGKIKDDCIVDCNDVGVEVSNVRVHCPMSEILKHPYTDAENVAFPQRLPWNHPDQGNLAVAQVSYFDCGGIAVGGCLSHKIGDACTISNFFYNWGILSRDKSVMPSPQFVGESIYPQSNDPYVVSTIKPEEPTKYLGKRFVFPAAKVNALKAKFSFDSGVQNPTRTEVVSTLIYKCALAARTRNFGSFKQSSLFQVSYMRERHNPPLSQDVSGNIVSGFSVETTNERDVNCPRLVSELRNEKEKLDQDKAKAIENAFISEVVDSIEKGRSPFNNDMFDYYFCLSLNAFPLYKTDFGWGKPTRVSLATGPFNRWFHLMDNQSGGGIEAIIMLGELDMFVFETDPELLEFATPIPNH
ncbi:acylsugar acyltransferase 3-like [Solanum tuberosum]|uniref:Acyltransferase n=1 Tax=Solanum tuberosum TaxID=4113 RepID=M1C5S9_SOLTU|nr:PREDICTED: acylsugar acyltransferase 3-like [Solanum tuberosum]